jgi:uncharacterized protein Yka (UPF0111/DUF47 family)
MFSLQRFLGKDEEFFTLLEASAEEGLASVEALKRVINNPSAAVNLDEFAASRRKDKIITAQISALLVKTSVTGMEREDIELLCNALYKIPKTIEKFAERYVLTGPEIRAVPFAKHVEMAEDAARTILTMLREIKTGMNLKKITEQNEHLQKVEGEADKLMLELLRDLYGGKYAAMHVIILKDLYELLEKVVDKCRDAGVVVSHIALKQS